MTNKITVDLNLTGEQQVSRGLKNVGDAASKAGDNFDGLGKDAGQLKKKISETEAEIKKLTKAFDETGDDKLLKSIRKEQSSLSILRRMAKAISDDVEDAVPDVGGKIGESLTKSLMALRGPAIAAAVGIGVIMAPAIGAAISSAVVGGIGVGGIVGGVAMAAQDQSVQIAAKLVASHVGDAFRDSAGSFVQPLVESLKILDGAGTRLAENLGKIGTSLAPLLPGLTGGATGFVENMLSGITKAMGRAGPALRTLSKELPKIGDAVGDLFDKISEDPDQAVMGIMAISQALQGVIDKTGDTLVVLGNLFEWSSRTGAAMSENMEMLFGWLPVAGTAIKNQGQNFRDQVAAIEKAKDASKDFVGNGIQPIVRAEGDVATVTKTATDRIKDQTTAMDEMFGRFMDPREAARNYQEAIDNLTESVKENGTSLDIGTEAGRSNTQALDDLATKIKETRESTILLTGDVAGANVTYYEQVEALRQQAIKLGLSKQAANDLAAGLRDIPRQVDVEVRLPGLQESIARMEHLRSLAGSNAAAARAFDAGEGTFKQGGDTSGYGGGRASGGPVYPGQLYTVGENGPELLQMGSSGGYVHNASQTAAMMSGASGGSRSQITISATAPPPDGTFMRELVRYAWPHILAQVRFDGGDLTAFGAAA